MNPHITNLTPKTAPIETIQTLLSTNDNPEAFKLALCEFLIRKTENGATTEECLKFLLTAYTDMTFLTARLYLDLNTLSSSVISFGAKMDAALKSASASASASASESSFPA